MRSQPYLIATATVPPVSVCPSIHTPPPPMGRGADRHARTGVSAPTGHPRLDSRHSRARSTIAVIVSRKPASEGPGAAESDRLSLSRVHCALVALVGAVWWRSARGYAVWQERRVLVSWLVIALYGALLASHWC